MAGTDIAVGGLAPGCALEVVLKFLAREWTAHVLRALGATEALHFGALRRAVPNQVSARMLSARLRELQAQGLVHRRGAERAGYKVAYSLTEEGRKLDAVLLAFQDALLPLPLPRPPDRTG
jgi:DNA-binding HxlR family transcriptional regulator